MKKIFFIAVFAMGCIETDIQAPLSESIRVVLTGDTFRVGGSYELQSEFLNSDGNVEDVPVTWQSSDPAIFRVEGNTGIGIEEGRVILTVIGEGVEGSEEIVVEESKASLQITMFVNQIQSGNNFNFGVNYIDLNGNSATPEVRWSSSDVSVATISPAGVVTAIAPGETVIRAETSLLSDEVSLMVVAGEINVDPEVRFTQFVEELNIGESFLFEAAFFGMDGMIDDAQDITWSSNNTEVLAINNNGLADGLAAGTAVIQASVGDVSAQFSVRVIDPDAMMRTGMLMGTGYDIRGSFSLQYNADNDLILTVEDYVPDGPGPYFYLTNQNNNVANGLNLGDAGDSGMYTINVSQIAQSESVEVDLFTYGVLMVWCEPFSVRLGFGEFDN